MATIRDVARVAGVSTATVSRIHTGSSSVSKATRDRVMAVAAWLDYWPNNAARSLITSRTHTLGVLLPDLYGEFYSEIIRGVDRAARLQDFQILVSSSHADAAALISVARSLRGRVDGLIVMAPDEGSAAAIGRITKKFPVVLINPRFSSDLNLCSTISIANFDGAYTLVSHLIGLGHRRIAMLKGPAGNVDAEERLRGYRSALAEQGGELFPSLEIEGDFTESSGSGCVSELLRHRPRPSAVFAANDYMAVGLLSGLSEAGLRVPEDMAVAGFDDIAVARYLRPPLTTMHVNAGELGERAVRQWSAHSGSDAQSEVRHEVLATTLVVRSSCGASVIHPGEKELGEAREGGPGRPRFVPNGEGAFRRQDSHPGGSV